MDRWNINGDTVKRINELLNEVTKARLNEEVVIAYTLLEEVYNNSILLIDYTEKENNEIEDKLKEIRALINAPANRNGTAPFQTQNTAKIKNFNQAMFKIYEFRKHLNNKLRKIMSKTVINEVLEGAI